MTFTEFYNSDSYYAGKEMDNDGLQEKEEEQDIFNTHVDDIIPYEYKVFQKLNHNEIKREIFNGNPCLLAIHQYRQQEFQSSYESLGYSRLIVDTTKKTGHAMVIIGYNDSIHGGSYRILNSWGNDWADNGKTWIKYKELDNVEKLIVSYNSNSFFDDTLFSRLMCFIDVFCLKALSTLTTTILITHGRVRMLMCNITHNIIKCIIILWPHSH